MMDTSLLILVRWIGVSVIAVGLWGCGGDSGSSSSASPGTSSNGTGGSSSNGGILGGCGNGMIEVGEACDDGADNSDTEPDACRTTCVRPGCGDGVVDAGESCDAGLNCTPECALLSCGDGVLDPGEFCDDGDANSDTEPGACRTTCAEAWCGDGVIDTGEDCDAGDGNSDGIPDVCRTDCTRARCGDGVVDSGEMCDGETMTTCEEQGFDPGGPVSCASCAFDTSACASLASCGNGVVDNGEECDPSVESMVVCSELGYETGAATCGAQNCRWDVSGCARCGDGMVTGSEVCDGEALLGQTCGDLGFDGGTLGCNACAAFDSSGCTWACEPSPEGDLDINLRTVRVEGEFLMDGVALPNETVPNDCRDENESLTRGSIRFTNLSTNRSIDFSLGYRGSARYDAWLPAARYRVTYTPPGGCWAEPPNSDWVFRTPSVMPRIDGQLEAALEVTGDGPLDLNLRTATVSGEFLMDGVALPNETVPDDCRDENESLTRGRVQITSLDTQGQLSFSLGHQGPAMWDAWVPAGRYRVTYAPPGGCWAEPPNSDWVFRTPSVMPKMSAELEAELVLSGVMDRDLDLRTARVEGEFLMDGVTLPNETAPDDCRDENESITRGSVRLVSLATNDSVSFSLGYTSVANYAHWVPAGTYRVEYTPPGGCWSEPPNSDWVFREPRVMPKMRAVLERELALVGVIERDLNLRTAMVSGRFTMDGATLPSETVPDDCRDENESLTRGAITFVSLDTQESRAFDLGRTGDATYNQWLPVGAYRVDYQPPSGCWAEPPNSDWVFRVPSVMPVLRAVVETSVVWEESGTRDIDLPTAMVSGRFLLDGAELPNEPVPDDCRDENESLTRGSVTFRNLESNATVNFSLGHDGPATYNYWLPGGQYEVRYEPPGGCWAEPPNSDWVFRTPSVMPTMNALILSCQEIR